MVDGLSQVHEPNTATPLLPFEPIRTDLPREERDEDAPDEEAFRLEELLLLRGGQVAVAVVRCV